MTALGVSFQAESANEFLTNAHWFDWGTLFLMFLGTIYGASKGLWREFVKLLWVLFLVFIVMELYPNVAEFLHTKTKMESRFATPAGYLIALTLSFLAILLIDGYLLKTMHTTVVPSIKILGGILFPLD